VTDGGDPACWLHRVCPECGRLAEEDPPTRCPACGAELPGDEAGHGPVPTTSSPPDPAIE
jgi:predicted amidophosphoribosyltransferase